MSTKWVEAISSINSYVKELKKKTDPIKVTVATFDTNNSGLSFDHLRNGSTLEEWIDINPEESWPRGMTPLYDAVIKMTSLARSVNPDNCALIIITDGMENSSREATKSSAKAALDACRKKGWQVIFLGADFENMSQAADLGNTQAQTMSVSADTMDFAMEETGRMRGIYASSGENMVYSSEVRQKTARK
jgi:Mg-chelatase subunit ChlD